MDQIKIEIMRIECKLCKRNLTGQAIALLEGKIKEIICKCKVKNKKQKL